MACSVTGVGEHIMRALLAKACAARMLDTEVSVQEACTAALLEGILRVTTLWHSPRNSAFDEVPQI